MSGYLLQFERDMSRINEIRNKLDEDSSLYSQQQLKVYVPRWNLLQKVTLFPRFDKQET